MAAPPPNNEHFPHQHPALMQIARHVGVKLLYAAAAFPCCPELEPRDFPEVTDVSGGLVRPAECSTRRCGDVQNET